MKRYGLLILIMFLFACSKWELVDYVNTKIGTDAHGHTYPGATTPFGMVQLSPDTDIQGWDWASGYHASNGSIMGFSHTHLSGTGGADLGDILFMPGVGEPKFIAGTTDNPESGYRSRFNHDSEKVHAGYYSVYLDDPKIWAELTVTQHVGVHRYKFDNPSKQHLIIDLTHGIGDKPTAGYIRKINDREIQGYRRSAGWADDHTVYFYAQFDQPIKDLSLMGDGMKIDGDSVYGTRVVAAVLFEGQQPEITAKVGISYVDIQGAKNNLCAETEGKSFDAVHKSARAMWNMELAKISIVANDKEKTLFYTSLYHTMLAPTIMSDVDGRYRGSDRQIHKDSHSNYGLFSLWDTFRALHPLLTIIEPQKNEYFIQSMIRYYTQSGRLPIWDLNMRETGCMIGYHSASVIWDAYQKGQRDFDAETALEAMVHSAMEDSYGGLEFYKQYGYIPAQKENNSVSKTLEYAYDDWCIAQMAKALGKDSLYQYFNRRAQSYKNVFDASDGFMKSRDAHGRFNPTFSPTRVSRLGEGDFTEGNSWHYSFFTPQDITTHIGLIGGEEQYIEKLDEMFQTSTMDIVNTPDVTGLIGNYAHGNEPSHHVAYLYSYAGQPWRTQERVDEIINSMYTIQRDGLCGNEDCGQMSAWYVLSAMGFYPVTPGSGDYVLGTPMFEEVNIRLPNGKTFTIQASNKKAKNIYIRSATWNGRPYTKAYITHQMISQGGTLVLDMGSVPSRTFGTGIGDRPVSAITDGAMSATELSSNLVYEPYFDEQRRIFNQSIDIVPKYIDTSKHVTIYYTTDGTEPTAWSKQTGDKITLYNDAVLKLRAIAPNGRSSSVGSYYFHKGLVDTGVTINGTTPNKAYPGEGLLALIDGYTGGNDYQSGRWLGYAGQDVTIGLKLNKAQKINGLGFNVLNRPISWILLPFGATATYYLGDKEILTQSIELPSSEAIGENVARYITIPGQATADRIKLTLHGGVLPYWHSATGNGAWIFVDEITLF